MGAPCGVPDGYVSDGSAGDVVGDGAREPAGASSRSVADPSEERPSEERPFAERLFARLFPWLFSRPLSWLFGCVIPRVFPCPFDWLLALPSAAPLACLLP
ncbi:hypothetical protein Sfr7A_29785 [Streptomyces xinghaiensis]|uniref:Uncharacterized protein n=1 Tax=Streptomyces xinghaiensis TaxID=1038928 RepID=A0A3R7J1Q8_9ACTN|nr:hypothetical protein Sfr7A_29785 [Streptomyces xinghaiensis]RKM94046.1 hypothetical protein SFRA_019815 [Streptomyces xinghaiensis]RNC69253.1 hypothetical protein DC095_029815 [Streptomyces xinghaiensis]